eukprot:151682_1
MDSDSSEEDLKTDDEPSPPPVGRSRASYDEADQIAQLQQQQPQHHSPSSRDSPSPRPPPNSKPPPVPPSKPSTNMLQGLDDKTASPSPKKRFSRGRLRRRRASLPSINILPSWGSLKTVMGFGVDEDDKETENKQNKETEPPNTTEEKGTKHRPGVPMSVPPMTKEKSTPYEKVIENHKNDKNKTLNKKLNPKEIKQLYIKNLKLQAQIDKLREKEKEFETKLQEQMFKVQEQMERCSDLEDQVQLKTEVIKKLNDQVIKAENVNDLTHKIQELERLLVEKDTNIQSLHQEMEQIKATKAAAIPAKIRTPTTEDIDRYMESHARSLTPGGYSLHPTSWDAGMNEEEKVTEARGVPVPSAPGREEQFLDDDTVKGMSLEQKLKQRPSWKEVHQRGILLDDPTTQRSIGLQEAHRGLRKRRASLTLDKMLINRPDVQRLQQQNIWKDKEEPKAQGLNLQKRLSQRPDVKEMQQRGILLDDPRYVSHHEQAKKRRAHKRKASKTINKLLMNRPTPNQLESSNIIDANTAALFFGASPVPHVLTSPNTEYIDSMMDATESLYAASTPRSRAQVSERLSLKLSQRPSMDETMARGILLFRTDTKVNYDLQSRYQQLHRRKASQNLEKMMFNRPTPVELETKGIMISNPTQKLKSHHKKKNSMDLEAGLKRRMSLSQMQGLGLLFMDHGLELGGGSSQEEEDEMMMMGDAEQQRNIASLFKQEPRMSKPLQQDIDFKGIEFGIQPNDDTRMPDKRRGSVDHEAGVFEPFRLSKKAKIARIGSKLQQRPSVDDMRMRGLLYDLPTTSKSLVERKRDLMRRRASNKVDHLLNNRPARHVLENKNILLREDETLDKRKRHKRKRSQILENAIQRRPKLMEEKEAQRQRKKSMTDHDFKPDYLQHILNDEEEDQYQQDMEQIEIRFLNVGGYVIPLVSPKFMSNLVHNQEENALDGHKQEDRNQQKEIEYQQDIEDLRDELEDLQEELGERDGEIRHKDREINRLKDDLTMLRSETSRKSLLDISSIQHNTKALAATHTRDVQQINKLKKEIESKQQYIDKLCFYFRETKGIASIPTPSQLKKEMRNKLTQHFKQRPSFHDLQRKAILSSNFINDVTNQKAQIAEKKLKFGRTSQKIGSWLPVRPTRDGIKQYFVELNSPTNDEEYFEELVDNATVYELREEIVRLNEMLAERVVVANKLERENSTMRVKIHTHLNETTEIMARGLKEHSVRESKVLNDVFADLQKESEENEMIVKLQEKNQILQQKVRRLSTIIPEAPVVSRDTTDEDGDRQIKELIRWSRQLSWPDVIVAMYGNYDTSHDERDESLHLMQNVMDTQRNLSQSKQRQLTEEMEKLRDVEENIHKEYREKMQIERMEHAKDKTRLVTNTMNELNRLRSELKDHGKATLQIQEQQQTSSTYYKYFFGK